MRISDWSSDVCSSDLHIAADRRDDAAQRRPIRRTSRPAGRTAEHTHANASLRPGTAAMPVIGSSERRYDRGGRMLDAPRGFEPRYAVSATAVLTLDDGAPEAGAIWPGASAGKAAGGARTEPAALPHFPARTPPQNNKGSHRRACTNGRGD